MKYAVIDIGSNSVRLLLWADGRSIYKKISTTRLAEGLAVSGTLNEAAMERTAAAVAAFAEEGVRAGAGGVFAFATAAVRGAGNGGAFVSLVRQKCGLAVDVIGGREEAACGWYGALRGRDGGIVDVGGASTEITVGRGGRIEYAVSADVGAVRLKDLCGEDEARLSEIIAEKTAVFGSVPPCPLLCAVGGTATSLAALETGCEPYDPAIIDGTVLSWNCVRAWADRLLSMPAAERLQLKGMDPRRADILGGGALLLAAAMQRAGADSVTVSESDNMEGYLHTVAGVRL